MKTLLTAIAITVAAISAPLSSSAQLSQKEIDDAVTAMRNAGIDEAKIEKFQADIAEANAKMEAFNANPPPELPDLKSGDELLAEQRAEFQQTYGNAPEANIAFRGETYSLKVTTCDQGEGWFVIEAKSEPGPQNAIFGSVMNTNPDGSSYATIDFQTGDLRAGSTVDSIQFDGDVLELESTVYASDNGNETPEPMTISLRCSR